jgi:hypothetical protein
MFGTSPTLISPFHPSVALFALSSSFSSSAAIYMKLRSGRTFFRAGTRLVFQLVETRTVLDIVSKWKSVISFLNLDDFIGV